ncbi:MAG: hypothetical protein HY952_03650 [Elusimicrobia bacterium]|nr:hypothetical protein [Elusimicrobiota bacterium]
MDLELKQRQFNSAMALYAERRRYAVFGKLVAAGNVSLQAFLLWRAAAVSLGFWGRLAALAAAWLLADFVNGLVHMHTDSMDDYESIGGPLIANFHLHHKRPRYTDSPLPLVYFNESASKVWLLPCLCALAWLAGRPGVNPWLLCALIYAGVLSSVAEVSHYLAHNSVSPAAAALARAGLLLDKRRHARHHLQDNVSYAFLNAATDPLVDFIAAKFYAGYKNGTDLHYAAYTAPSADRDAGAGG